MTYPCKILADILEVPVQKSPARRRRAEGAVRQLAAPCRDGGRTNRVRFVTARCADLARMIRADRRAFDRFVAEVLGDEG